MEVKFKAVPMDYAVEHGYPGADDETEWNAWGVWRFEDGKAVELVGEDGGEPEDQTLYRAWAWVATALNEAYRRGHADARAEYEWLPRA